MAARPDIQERRNRLRAAGYCISCGQVPASGFCSECKDKRSKRHAKYRAIHRNRLNVYTAEWHQQRDSGNCDLDSYFKRVYHRLRSNCRPTQLQRERGDITHQPAILISASELTERWQQQAGLCVLTCLPMLLRYKELASVSVDRIDSNGDYESANIQLVCRWVNLGRRAQPIPAVRKFLTDLLLPCADGIDQPLARLHAVGMVRNINKRGKGRMIYSEIRDLWSQQRGVCALTGVGMVDEYGHPHSCSVDRIDSSLGYSLGNVQLVCQFANLAKGKFSNAEFLDVLRMYRELHIHKELING